MGLKIFLSNCWCAYSLVLDKRPPPLINFRKFFPHTPHPPDLIWTLRLLIHIYLYYLLWKSLEIYEYVHLIYLQKSVSFVKANKHLIWSTIKLHIPDFRQDHPYLSMVVLRNYVLTHPVLTHIWKTNKYKTLIKFLVSNVLNTRIHRTVVKEKEASNLLSYLL